MSAESVLDTSLATWAYLSIVHTVRVSCTKTYVSGTWRFSQHICWIYSCLFCIYWFEIKKIVALVAKLVIPSNLPQSLISQPFIKRVRRHVELSVMLWSLFSSIKMDWYKKAGKSRQRIDYNILFILLLPSSLQRWYFSFDIIVREKKRLRSYLGLWITF